MQVGSLQAVYMAKRGYEVHLFEGRSGNHLLPNLQYESALTVPSTDIRKQPRYTGLSINLALSKRGLAALEDVGVEAAVRHSLKKSHFLLVTGLCRF